MPREQQVLDLIGNIYDAALDASRWPSVLHDLIRLTHSNTANLAVLNVATGATRALASVDIPAKAFSDYSDYHWQKDIWTPKPGSFEVGRAYTSQHHVPDCVLIRSEIYNDWMKPIHLFYGLGGIPLVDGSTMLLIGVHRPWSRQRPYSEQDIRLLQQLFPHFKRALQTHHRLDQLTVEREALVETTDQLPRGLITFDRQGRLLWMNRAAETICDQADGLTIQRGHVTAAVAAETERLHRLIHQANQLADRATVVRVDDAMLVSRPSGRRPYVVLVTPLQAGRRLVDDRHPAVALFVSDPERMPELPAARLSRLYGLTPAEAQLALQVAGGHDLREIAAMSTRTMNTIRTQLKQIFLKTGTTRQADLVRLLMNTEGITRASDMRHNNRRGA